MKKTSLTLLMAVVMLNVQAQRSVPKICEIVNELHQIYYVQDGSDTIIYNRLCEYIAECERKIAKKPSDGLNVELALWHYYLSCHLDNMKGHSSYGGAVEIIWDEEHGILKEGSSASAVSDRPDEWDYATLRKKSMEHLRLALKDANSLKNTNLQDYKKLIEPGDTIGYFNSLYEIILNKYCQQIPRSYDDEHFGSGDEYDYAKFLQLDNENFLLSELAPNDSSSYAQCIRLMQELLATQIEVGNTLPIIASTLCRWQKSSLAANSETHESQLLALEKQYRNQPGYAMICEALGCFYALRADKTEGKEDDYVTAMHWYTKAYESDKEQELTLSKIAISEISKPHAICSFDNFVSPEPQLLPIISRNCENVFIRIYRVADKKKNSCKLAFDTVVPMETKGIYRTDTNCIAIPALPVGEYIALYNFSHLPDNFIDARKESYSAFSFRVTQMLVLSYTHHNSLYFRTYNRKNGMPVPDVTISDDNGQSVKSDSTGLAIWKAKIADNDPYDHTIRQDMTAQKGNDELPFWIRTSFGRNASAQSKIKVFTDRAIYRPGQTIHFKAIAYNEYGFTTSAQANQQIEFFLYNGYQKVATSDTLTTNEFGSCAGTFEIPSDGGLGNFEIRAYAITNDLRSGSASIKVEEYKRPQFEVAMQQPQDAFRIGDSISVEGNVKAYAGYPIQNATVVYQITRYSYFPFRYHGWNTSYHQYYQYYNNPYGEPASRSKIANGECITDENGIFHISFLASGDSSQMKFWPLYHYKITAIVIDINGEMHETTACIPASNRAISFTIDIPKIVQNIDLQENKFPLIAKNLSDAVQNIPIHYELHPLQMPDNYLLKAPFKFPCAKEKFGKIFPQYAFEGEEEISNWEVLPAIASGEITSSEHSAFSFPIGNQLADGRYRLIVSATDAFGNKVEEEREFYVSRNSASCKIYSPLTLISDKKSIDVGETVNFTISSYLPDAYVDIFIDCNDKTIERRSVHLQKSGITIPITATEEMRGYLQCRAIAAYEGTDYTQTLTIPIIFSNKKIDTEIVTFRDELSPGERTSVKISLQTQGKPIQAEMLCSMYDASLDAFAPHLFNMRFQRDISPYYSFKNMPFFAFYGTHYGYRLWFGGPDVPVHLISLPSINIDRPWMVCGSSRGSSRRSSKAANLTLSCLAAEACTEEAEDSYAKSYARVLDAVDNDVVESAVTVEIESASEFEENTQPRTNFAETAFFLPFLQTDKNGNIEFEYTVPEALTRWKMQGFAHTPDMKTGSFEKFVVTKKNVMMVPNWPRFVYEGDTIVFSAKVVNQSENAIKGTAKLTLANAANGEAIAIAQNIANQKVTVDANGVCNVTFRVAVPMGIAGMTCTFMVETEANGSRIRYSDGEEKTLPVLSKRMLLTEAQPFFITQKGEKTFPIKGMAQDGIDVASCKLEFTPNPKWYALTALPYLMEYPYDCNEQIFSKLYANSMAAFVAQQNAGLLPTLEKYAADSTSSAFCSNLAKNQDVKQILLEETPWFRDASNEEERMLLMFNLFDKKRMSSEASTMVQKLEKNQNHDGSWSWFGKGDGSLYITQHILGGAGRLIDKQICQPGRNFLSESTLRSALRFVDKRTEKEYQEYKTWVKKNKAENHQIGYCDIQYIYVRSYFLRSAKPSGEAYDFYLKKMVEDAQQILKEDYPHHSIYLTAMEAMALYRIGKHNKNEQYLTLANDIILKIKGLAQHSEEMGMWWKQHGYAYFWHNAPIEQQALLIEAFETILQDYASAEEMRIWLLQQKRTQSWGTTRNTAEACLALLADNQKVEKQQGEISLSVCGETLHFSDTLQPGFGKSLEGCLGKKSQNAPAEVRLSRTDDQLAYGAVYYQYYQDIDQVKETEGNPLSISRELFRVDATEQGTRLTKLNDKTQLKVGDKVCVRIVIRTDRDLEFVHLKDLRAAAFEPTETLSTHRYQDGLYYYQTIRDASVNFFFDWVKKGTYVFEYQMFVTQAGTFSSGYSSIQCMYAPEFVSHSTGGKIRILER